MNHALGMRISDPLPCHASSSLLRNKMYGRRMLLFTPVLLEIKPELGKFLKSHLRTNKLTNPFQAKLPSCLFLQKQKELRIVRRTQIAL